VTGVAPGGAAQVLPVGQPDDFASAPKSQGRIALGRFVRNKVAMAATLLFVLIVVVSFVAPSLYHWKYDHADLDALSVQPGRQGHVLGTDETGFDLLARLMRGTQRDFVVIVVSTTIAVFLGTFVGAVAGYYGKLIDNLLMRMVDIMLVVPSLVILIVACKAFPAAATAQGIAVIFGLFGWMGLSRLVRAQVLSLREREFVEAARALGASDLRIVLRHLIPNVLPTILVFGTLFAAISIVAETSVTYLGYGVQPPDTSLGLLVTRGVDAVDTRSWLFYYPGTLIVVIVLAVNLIGEGIRKAFDPRHVQVRE